MRVWIIFVYNYFCACSNYLAYPTSLSGSILLIWPRGALGILTCVFKMAAEEVKKIAEEAVENINKITSLINNRTLPPPIQNVSAASSAINELQRRFPTLNSSSAQSATPRSSGRRSSSRSHPYQSSASYGGFEGTLILCALIYSRVLLNSHWVL